MSATKFDLKFIKDLLAYASQLSLFEHPYIAKDSLKNWTSHYEALYLLNNAVHNQKFLNNVKLVDSISQDTLDDGIYWLKEANQSFVGEPFGDNKVVAFHETFVVVQEQPYGTLLDKLMGDDQSILTNANFYQNNAIKSLVAFEIISVVNPNNLGGNDIDYAFKTNPKHIVFSFYISPSAVNALVLNNDFKSMIAKIVQPREFAQQFNINDDRITALTFDMKNALLYLKHRFSFNIDDELLKVVSDFDDNIAKQSENFCIEVT